MHRRVAVWMLMGDGDEGRRGRGFRGRGFARCELDRPADVHCWSQQQRADRDRELDTSERSVSILTLFIVVRCAHNLL